MNNKLVDVGDIVKIMHISVKTYHLWTSYLIIWLFKVLSFTLYFEELLQFRISITYRMNLVQKIFQRHIFHLFVLTRKENFKRPSRISCLKYYEKMFFLHLSILISIPFSINANLMVFECTVSFSPIDEQNRNFTRRLIKLFLYVVLPISKFIRKTN